MPPGAELEESRRKGALRRRGHSHTITLISRQQVSEHQVDAKFVRHSLWERDGESQKKKMIFS